MEDMGPHAAPADSAPPVEPAPAPPPESEAPARAGAEEGGLPGVMPSATMQASFSSTSLASGLSVTEAVAHVYAADVGVSLHNETVRMGHGSRGLEPADPC